MLTVVRYTRSPFRIENSRKTYGTSSFCASISPSEIENSYVHYDMYHDDAREGYSCEYCASSIRLREESGRHDAYHQMPWRISQLVDLSSACYHVYVFLFMFIKPYTIISLHKCIPLSNHYSIFQSAAIIRFHSSRARLYP